VLEPGENVDATRAALADQRSCPLQLSEIVLGAAKDLAKSAALGVPLLSRKHGSRTMPALATKTPNPLLIEGNFGERIWTRIVSRAQLIR
jgi:hypothetical protein